MTLVDMMKIPFDDYIATIYNFSINLALKKKITLSTFKNLLAVHL